MKVKIKCLETTTEKLWKQAFFQANKICLLNNNLPNLELVYETLSIIHHYIIIFDTKFDWNGVVI